MKEGYHKINRKSRRKYHLLFNKALVTGATGALGEDICRVLAKNIQNIFIGYYQRLDIANKLASEISTLGSLGIPIKIDVTNEKDVDNCFNNIKKKGLICQILINCAGISPGAIEVEKMKVIDWRRTIEVNLTGSFICCKYAVGSMNESGWGRIINVSSIFGRTTPATRSAYGASKHGLIGLTQSLSRELAKYNITVNAVCPGPMDTPLVRKVWQQHADSLGISFDKYYSQKIANIPIGRLCTTQEVAEVIGFLASEKASFISGATIDISGAEI